MGNALFAIAHLLFLSFRKWENRYFLFPTYLWPGIPAFYKWETAILLSPTYFLRFKPSKYKWETAILSNPTYCLFSEAFRQSLRCRTMQFCPTFFCKRKRSAPYAWCFPNAAGRRSGQGPWPQVWDAGVPLTSPKNRGTDARGCKRLSLEPSP